MGCRARHGQMQMSFNTSIYSGAVRRIMKLLQMLQVVIQTLKMCATSGLARDGMVGLHSTNSTHLCEHQHNMIVKFGAIESPEQPGQ